MNSKLIWVEKDENGKVSYCYQWLILILFVLSILNISIKIDPRDMKRNKLGNSFIYTYTDNLSSQFCSFYGDIEYCKVKTKIIHL